MKTKNTAVLLAHCPDQQGIIASVTDFLHSNKGNIVKLEQHVDMKHEHFFMRVEWELDDFLIPKAKIEEFFNTLVASRYEMKWELHFSEKPVRMAIFVSKMSHCLYDILQRWASKEWGTEKPIIISNHSNLEYIAKRFDIPFYHFPITKENKVEQEEKMLALLAEQDIDLIILARYMQIITNTLINTYRNKIINIHHSFLPAFIGARPYHQAYERGVKVIGATSHFVTEELDAGPIIEQDVAKISHRDNVKDLIRKGKDVEKLVLSRAIWLMINHRILPFQNRTVIFD